MQRKKESPPFILKLIPPRLSYWRKREKRKLIDVQTVQKKAVLEKYGGAEYLDGVGGLATAIESEKPMNDAERKSRFGVSVILRNNI
jgi:hypothetical protein